MQIDSVILKECVRNNRKAQKALYEYCFRMLMPVCYRYHINEEDARSSLNIAFLKIIQSLSNVDLEEINFNAWAKRITINTLIDEYRKQKLQNERYHKKETDYELDIHAKRISNTAESSFGYEHILKLLSEIPSVSAKVFELYIIDGYTHKEIGELLEISEGTSKWHLSSARKLLRDKLERLDILSEKKRSI